MTQITYRQALNQALREEMSRDSNVILIGVSIAGYRNGGIFGVTEGLLAEFGDQRVIETPISEGAIVGSSVGAAMSGMRPVAEIMDSEFLVTCYQQLVAEAAQVRFLGNGEIMVPLVVRTPFGAVTPGIPMQQKSPEGWFLHVPGLKVVAPSTARDAKGLMKAAIRDDNPVLFFEHKRLYEMSGEVPESDYVVPLGKADIKRDGRDVTVIATAAMVHEALAVATKLSAQGTEVEVLDPRTLYPLDRDTILRSAQKTQRVVIVHEAPKTGGIGAEIGAMLAEEAFGALKAPVVRVAGPDVPLPFVPSQADIEHAVKSVLEYRS